MLAKKALNNLKRAEPKQIAGRMLHGHSSIVGAMLWMFAVSVLLTFALGWIPLAGPFIGPAVGGYIGGRRAGSIVRAMLAAMLPVLLLSILILGIGAIAASFTDLPVLGAVAAVVAGAAVLILIIHNLVLFLSALVGGLVRKLEEV
jgi:amino acid transporter